MLGQGLLLDTYALQAVQGLSLKIQLCMLHSRVTPKMHTPIEIKKSDECLCSPFPHVKRIV